MERVAPSRWPALLVLCAGSLMIILDGTVVAVALPAVQRDLGFTAAGLAWVVNAYLVAFGGLLLLAGRLGDLLGRRGVFLAGVVLFTVASLACAVATGPALLVIARFGQGVGGALAMAVSLGMIVRLYPEPAERARAIAVFSFTGAAGASVGTVAGGVLTEAAGWRTIFLVNVPIGAVILVAALRRLPAERGIGLRAGLDLPGALLATAGLMAAVLGIVGTGEHGWTSPRTLGAVALAALLLGGFALRQRVAAAPLVPSRVLRVPGLLAANAVQFLMVCAYFGFQFLLAVELQLVLGLDAAATGWAFLPTPVVIAVVSLGLAGPLIARFGARTVLLVGLGLATVGFLVLARLPADGAYVADVLPAMLIFGVAGGLTLPAVTTLAMAGATDTDAGLASGLANTTQQVGGAVGLAALATLAAARSDGLRAAGWAETAALAGGYRTAFAVAAALVVVAWLVALTTLPRRSTGSSQTTDPAARPWWAPEPIRTEAPRPVDRRHRGREGGRVSEADETRDGVALTNLDQPLSDRDDATKRDLVDYLDAVRDRILPQLRGRPLSVIRVRPGQPPFMQKNLPRYTPDWVRRAPVWAEASHREISYALCDDRRTLLWFANQRAVEYHPTLATVTDLHRPTHLILDLDPPDGDGFRAAVDAALLVRQALADAGLAGAVKTSGAKGVHVFVPVTDEPTAEELAAATRALAVRAERLDPALATTAYIKEDRGGRVFVDATRAGGATVAAAYSPRLRPGMPVSFPVDWADLTAVTPADFTIRTAPALLADGDPWAALMPAPQPLPADLVAEGRTIPVARVQAMHEGKRRARARRDAG